MTRIECILNCMNRTYYTVYKITCLANGKYYVGCHKTDNLDDGYMGSGVLITRLVKKYGLHSFTKEYLAIFDNPNDMFEMESQIVNEEFLVNESTLNLALGGNGGWMTVNSSLTHEDRQKISKLGNVAYKEKLNSDSDFATKIGKKISDSLKSQWEQGLFAEKPLTGFYKLTKEGEFHHTSETKEKIKNSLAKKLQGTVWVKNKDLNLTKQIPVDELQNHLDDGWEKGRLLSDKGREKLKQQKSGAQHSCFGRCRIYHEELKKNKMVPKDDLSHWFNEGWKLGFQKQLTR